MDFNKNRSTGPTHPSPTYPDHLTYLKKELSKSGRKDVAETLKKDLFCAVCGHPVTKVSEKIEVHGFHDHSFTNLGYLVQLGCFRNAVGCIGVQGVSHGYSWFRGYAWQIQVCEECYSQLGWKYMSPTDSFYGLMFNMLREEESDL